MTAYADLTKGPAWEYRVQRAAFLSGWYVRRGINLRERVQGSPQTMAEVDIIGFGFDPALSPRTLIGECKDRKGATKEADRIVWLLGLSRLLRADHVLFAKPKLAPATLQFAQPYGTMLWDEPTVRAIEQRFKLDPDSGYFGSFNVGLQEDVLRPARKSSAIVDRPLRAAWDYLSGAFWYGGTPTRTKLLRGYFDALTSASRLPGDARSGLVAEGLIALLVSAYTTAGHLGRMSPAQGDLVQNAALAAGAANARALREIAARADDYYQDALKRALQQREATAAIEVNVPRLVNAVAAAPDWAPAYLAFARRLGEHPLIAGDALRYADMVLFEHLLADGDISSLLGRVFHFDTAPLRTVLDLGALFLKRIWGIEDSFLDRVLSSPPKQKRSRSTSRALPKVKNPPPPGESLFDLTTDI